ncbi:cob(I)yrinic acid a,c-diamide adenosyltransferase [Algoriphagus halophytocola]|uniref:Corrinoid adenosyltransferase n=1 Tax=Algoriphagus halophytocola TaxID=2991499 RepID=A0ABY6MIT5_9BACT|nr:MULTISPECIES: cob(I)yrinic acid a,c-diamide adenosyltransferase [unclassified Algoriphagus]UZD23705.1 cob(I)yrinic acid a,c-diamide adenosyltransferase [Algoriphagus sp. TR-M5]WBL44999.1 cob(I)yrinic acid a,c-diamide adenosyltransferase [Algoriphagus sp. TR-M9]
MKIYTKTGDEGQTSLLGGTRVPKFDVRIDAYGTVDELNSHIGMLKDQEVNWMRAEVLKEIQDRLFTIGADLATDPAKQNVKKPDLLESDIEMLEKQIDEMEKPLPPLKSFILPGGHPSVSFGHLARTVCRRCERIVSELAAMEEVSELVIKYLNRLSDYLFVLCRKMAQELNVNEITWNPRK